MRRDALREQRVRQREGRSQCHLGDYEKHKCRFHAVRRHALSLSLPIGGMNPRYPMSVTRTDGSLRRTDLPDRTSGAVTALRASNPEVVAAGPIVKSACVNPGDQVPLGK